MSNPVRLHPHDPAWTAAYQTEATALSPIIGDQLVLVEHIGSTAIPDIKAKPIIDILIVVSEITSVKKIIPAMAALGYRHRGEHGIPGRQFFPKDIDGLRSHHVHIYQQGHEAISKHLNFRDYLRAHQARAQAYSKLKEELAVIFRNDRATYSESKTDFIEETNRIAAEWRKGK